MIITQHIILDDKFIDFIISDFDRFSELNNRYILFSDVNHIMLNSIKNVNRVEVVVINSEEYNQLLTNVDIVVFHTFHHPWAMKFLKDLKANPIIFWIPWGFDYISQIELDLFKPKTKELYNKIFNKEHPHVQTNTLWRNPITNYVRTLRTKIQLKSLFKKIDYCSSVVSTEFPLIQRIKGFRANYLAYEIGELNSPYDNINEIEMLGEAIWIGNSYTLTNNHLDVFYQLRELNVQNEIIVPLSYGLNPIDHPELIIIGNELFGLKFTPIVNFMPIDEYTKLLKKSRIAIFNHLRQQASANISMMLWQGSKVFLSEISPVYEYLKQNGMVLFSIENELTIENINTPLTLEQIKQNKKLINKLYSKESITKINEDTIQYLIQNVKNKLFLTS